MCLPLYEVIPSPFALQLNHKQTETEFSVFSPIPVFGYRIYHLTAKLWQESVMFPHDTAPGPAQYKLP